MKSHQNVYSVRMKPLDSMCIIVLFKKKTKITGKNKNIHQFMLNIDTHKI